MEELEGRLNIINNHKYDYLNHIGSPFQDRRLWIKRIFDLIFGLIFMACSIPFIVIFGILIKLTSKGPIFYKQVRVGYLGRPFEIIKLRSMKQDAEAKTGPIWAMKKDPRVTKVGRFMRRTKIDEMPQFWNVLKGDMSIVGPRPERPYFTEKFYHNNSEFPKRLRIKPGITGYSQVHGGYDMTPDQRIEMDEYYMNHYSLHMDALIVLQTVIMMFTGNGTR